MSGRADSPRTGRWPNTGTTTINGWTLRFSFPGDQILTNVWNATATQSGAAVAATNVSYDGTSGRGGSTSFGFQGTRTAGDVVSTTFTLNGATCA